MVPLRFLALCLAYATMACGAEHASLPAGRSSGASGATGSAAPIEGGASADPPRADAKGSVPRGAASAPSVLPTATGGAAPAPAPTEEPSCQPSRVVLTPDLRNARDLGGVALASSGTVACGAYFRGPPLRLSEQGCQQLREIGVRTVIDLRIEGEQSSAPDATCGVAELVSAPLPIPYGLGAEDYLRDLNATDSIAKAFHVFGDPSSYPIYFHCTYGRDRTGVVGALLLLTLGASREAVMAEYLLSQPNVGAYPASLTAVLDEIERRGGPEQVLSEAGISADEIAVMREHVLLD